MGLLEQEGLVLLMHDYQEPLISFLPYVPSDKRTRDISPHDRVDQFLTFPQAIHFFPSLRSFANASLAQLTLFPF